MVTLSALAKMLEKPVQKVYRMAQEAGAIKIKPKDENIYIDVEVFQSYTDKVINEELKILNSR
jgi:hypothetical protein